jgi:hypothetical protein
VNEMLICEVCGKSFEPNKYYHNGNQRYCSEECRKTGIRKYQKDYMRNYMRTHPKYTIKNHEYNRKQKIEVLTHYSNPPKCACCGEDHIEFLCLDHINGGGNVERFKVRGRDKRGKSKAGVTFYFWLRTQGFPEGYQILCSNCNMAKGQKKVKFCPVHHQELYAFATIVSL